MGEIEERISLWRDNHICSSCKTLLAIRQRAHDENNRDQGLDLVWNLDGIQHFSTGMFRALRVFLWSGRKISYAWMDTMAAGGQLKNATQHVPIGKDTRRAIVRCLSERVSFVDGMRRQQQTQSENNGPQREASASVLPGCTVAAQEVSPGTESERGPS